MREEGDASCNDVVMRLTLAHGGTPRKVAIDDLVGAAPSLSRTLLGRAAPMRACPPRLAHHYANERLVHRPESAWGRRLAERIDGWQALRAA